MSGPPPPPRNKRRPHPVPRSHVQDFDQSGFQSDDSMTPSGAAYNVPRRRSPPGNEDADLNGAPAGGGRAFPPNRDRGFKASPRPSPRPPQRDDAPETTIGEAVKIKGELSFERLLRIDGTFEGDLQSSGDLVIGPRGTLVGDVNGMGSLLVDGKLIGNIQCEQVELRGQAFVYGDVTCKSLRLDPTATVVGTLNVHENAPQKINKDGSVEQEEAAPETADPQSTEGGAGGEDGAAPSGDAPAATDGGGDAPAAAAADGGGEAAAPAAEETPAAAEETPAAAEGGES